MKNERLVRRELSGFADIIGRMKRHACLLVALSLLTVGLAAQRAETSRSSESRAAVLS
jgi:hypothetical protein